MSAETKQALENALHAHIMDETGDSMNAWVIVAECTDIDELTNQGGSFYVDAREYQSRFLTNGLLSAAAMWGTE